ncbi:hypothetical protein ILUMI_01950 [Ignelater luminosus]|uniref:DDE-1 domain-containing protein n=1 Tax=Ignelater luminosus TaxID=2038154 RepID=A0A8K0DHF4_IGNLU|nr:hypothetical protein ILUMI_01950 [Ignelater luminosus]
MNGCHERIFNLDETGPETSHKTTHALKEVENLQSTWVRGGISAALYGVTESGWTQKFIFEKWLSAFADQAKNIAKPILLIFDRHGSHLTYNPTRIAREEQIIFLCLPPNTYHALQPMDAGAFGPMKGAWKNMLQSWSSSAGQPIIVPGPLAGQPVDHANVPNAPGPSPMKTLRDAYIQTMSPDQSQDVQAALKNPKMKRPRVQGNSEDVLTSKEIQE